MPIPRSVPALSNPGLGPSGFSFPVYGLCLAALAAAAGAAAGPILSEAFADPTAVADAQGEFLELGNPDADTLRLDSLRIDADAQGLVLSGLVLAPGALFLLCRDSLPAENGGMECGRQWSGLSLANTRGAQVKLGWRGGGEDYALPAPRPGVSWENTWEADAGYRRFLASLGPRPGGDSATPGLRNSRSARKAERDLGIMQVTWVPARPSVKGAEGGGVLQVRVANLGTGDVPATHLSLRLDADWDGEAETLLDSVPVAAPSAGETVARITMGAGLRGIVHAVLGPDEDPGNNAFLLPVEPGRPLAFTEWHAAPQAGEAEWVEIRNRTADSGGIGRKLDLAGAAFNGHALGSKAGGLEPGGFLVLTGSLDKFAARYGALKARVLPITGWRPLRNSGDTLTLSLAGFTVDSVAYGADGEAVGDGMARTRDGSAGPGASTPGYAAAAVTEDAWSLSGKTVGPGRPLDVEVGLLRGSYVLRVFDLEGNQVRELGCGGPGRRVHTWDGTDEGGRSLRSGPYLLALAIAGKRAKRQAVVLTGTR